MLLFGSGSQLVEVYKDRALALSPLNTTLARRMMERTRVYEALKGVLGAAGGLRGAREASRALLPARRRAASHQRGRRKPPLASREGLAALDVRIVLHDPDIEVEAEELPETAIRPYPTQYVSREELKDGTLLTVRPIRPEDESLMVSFHESLSERSVSMRYFHALRLDQRGSPTSA
ncbi:MAG: acetate--CoA ligase family protein [Rubrobacter sp.]|nr:acetate--CoA ligase family protein [Rubrobacter sp.]